MSLQLNARERLPFKAYPENPEEDGRNIIQMPLLLADNRVPMSVSELMQRRMQVVGTELQYSWWNNYFDTSDGILYHPDGRIKIELDAKFGRELNTDSKLVKGAAILPNNYFEKADGLTLTKEDFVKYKDEIWAVLARDPTLSSEYTAKVKELTKRDNVIRFWVHDAYDVPVGRLWCVGNLDGSADAGGSNSLDNDSGRFVGVAPEALITDQTVELKENSMEEKVQRALRSAEYRHLKQ